MTEQFNYYNHIAPIYDQTRWMTESVAEDVADFILALVHATPETSFLEPGVGTGLNVLPLVKRGYSVTGVDISKEMLHQFHQKLHPLSQNLTLLHQDASQLPFPHHSFDVVMTVHMLHTVSNWKAFLNNIDYILRPKGCYLNAQWITPPARREFEGYFRSILSRYADIPKLERVDAARQEIDVENYLHHKGYCSSYFVARKWMVSNTVEELLSFLKLRAYGFCWHVSYEIFHQALYKFTEFCIEHYGSPMTELSSEASFEIWMYTPS